MSGTVSVPNLFAAVTSGTTPQLDANFAALVAAFNNPLTYAMYSTDSGAVNAYVATLAPAPANQAALLGVAISIKVNNSNTTGSTLNVNALGVQAIVNPDMSAVAPGQIQGGAVIVVVWDGTNYRLVSGNVVTGVARMSISGLIQANNGTDNLDISAGAATDSTGTVNMVLATAITKQTNVAWAVGTGAGALDTGAVANSDYYIWLIKRTDTGVVDVLTSLSATAPTMPTNYTVKRLIGWFKRVGGVVVAFTAYETEGGGMELSWNVPTLDINLANTLTTARRTDAVKVPLNFSVIAHLNVLLGDATTQQEAWICCPDQTDAAPSTSVAPLANYESITATSQPRALRIRTSAAGLIAARSTLATVDVYAVSTMGFTWARRNS